MNIKACWRLTHLVAMFCTFATALAIAAEPGVLTQAVLGDDLQAARSAIDGGAPIDAIDPVAGHTPLYAAVSPGGPRYRDMIELLISKGARLDVIDATTQLTPLVAAMVVTERGPFAQLERSRAANIVEALLNGGANPNQVLKAGESPLMLAVGMNNLAVVQLLLARGANPNLRDADQSTALHVAYATDRPATMIDALTAAGANPNLRDAQGKLPHELSPQFVPVTPPAPAQVAPATAAAQTSAALAPEPPKSSMTKWLIGGAVVATAVVGSALLAHLVKEQKKKKASGAAPGNVPSAPPPAPAVQGPVIVFWLNGGVTPANGQPWSPVRCTAAAGVDPNCVMVREGDIANLMVEIGEKEGPAQRLPLTVQLSSSEPGVFPVPATLVVPPRAAGQKPDPLCTGRNPNWPCIKTRVPVPVRVGAIAGIRGNGLVTITASIPTDTPKTSQMMVNLAAKTPAPQPPAVGGLLLPPPHALQVPATTPTPPQPAPAPIVRPSPISQPVPTPIFQPSPIPQPAPVGQPAPAPTPMPIPVVRPQPQPVPQPVPQPTPVPIAPPQPAPQPAPVVSCVAPSVLQNGACVAAPPPAALVTPPGPGIAMSSLGLVIAQAELVPSQPRSGESFMVRAVLRNVTAYPFDNASWQVTDAAHRVLYSGGLRFLPQQQLTVVTPSLGNRDSRSQSLRIDLSHGSTTDPALTAKFRTFASQSRELALPAEAPAAIVPPVVVGQPQPTPPVAVVPAPPPAQTVTPPAAPGTPAPSYKLTVTTVFPSWYRPNDCRDFRGVVLPDCVRRAYGGTVSGVGQGGMYAGGTSVTLNAQPDRGRMVAAWSGGGCSGTSNSCTVTMNANTSVTVSFGEAPRYSWSAEAIPRNGGKISQPLSVGGKSYDGGTSGDGLRGDAISLNATPKPGYTFAGWSGGGCSGTGICAFSLSGDTVIAATFAPITHALIVIASPPDGGTVSAGESGTGTAYAEGSSVTLTAVPSAGYILTGWSGGECSGTGSSCKVTIRSETKVVANFTAPLYKLNTGVLPKEGGRVELNPSAASYARGTRVVATAIPAPGYSFYMWNLGCTGPSASCVVTANADAAFVAWFYLTSAGRPPSHTIGNPGGSVCTMNADRSFTCRDRNTGACTSGCPATGSTGSGGGSSGAIYELGGRQVNPYTSAAYFDTNCLQIASRSAYKLAYTVSGATYYQQSLHATRAECEAAGKAWVANGGKSGGAAGGAAGGTGGATSPDSGSATGGGGANAGGYQCATTKKPFDPDWIQSHGSYWAAASAHDAYAACLKTKPQAACQEFYIRETKLCEYAKSACLAVATSASSCPG